MSQAAPLAISPEVCRFHEENLVFLAYTVTPMHLTREGASLSHMRQRLDEPSKTANPTAAGTRL